MPPIEVVISALGEVARLHGVEAYMAVLNHFGATVVEELDPADYQAVLDYIQETFKIGVGAHDWPNKASAGIDSKAIWARYNRKQPD